LVKKGCQKNQKGIVDVSSKIQAINENENETHIVMKLLFQIQINFFQDF
jgi:hypothetical protein